MSITLGGLKNAKGQKFVFLNARSLYGHLNDLQVEFNHTNFYALAFTETWLKSKLPDAMIKIRGYVPCRLDREDKRGGGVLFYRKIFDLK